MITISVGISVLRSSFSFLSSPTVGSNRAIVTGTGSITTTQRPLFNKLFSSASSTGKYPILADEEVMSEKSHGTSEKPVQKNLRWNCDYNTADRICNFSTYRLLNGSCIEAREISHDPVANSIVLFSLLGLVIFRSTLC
jgi:hypothetical protein